MLPLEAPPLPHVKDTGKSHRWARWLIYALSWGSVMGVCFALFASMHEQELSSRARARMEAARAQQTWQQWELWHPPAPMEGGMAQHPPLEAEIGRQLLRTWAVASKTRPLPPALRDRLDASPFLVRLWYNRVPPETLPTAELILRSRSQGPSLQLKRRISLHLPDVLMLDADVADIVAKRCPHRCAELANNEGDGEGLALILTALLDDPDLTTAFEALDLLLSAQENAIPLLEARLERPTPQSGQALAFIGLSQLYDATRRKALLHDALTGASRGLRVLALLEVLRTGDASVPLPPEVVVDIPAGEVLRQYVMAELDRAAPLKTTHTETALPPAAQQ